MAGRTAALLHPYSAGREIEVVAYHHHILRGELKLAPQGGDDISGVVHVSEGFDEYHFLPAIAAFSGTVFFSKTFFKRNAGLLSGLLHR